VQFDSHSDIAAVGMARQNDEGQVGCIGRMAAAQFLEQVQAIHRLHFHIAQHQVHHAHVQRAHGLPSGLRNVLGTDSIVCSDWLTSVRTSD
jgi:hypothetical protein